MDLLIQKALTQHSLNQESKPNVGLGTFVDFLPQMIRMRNVNQDIVTQILFCFCCLPEVNALLLGRFFENARATD